MASILKVDTLTGVTTAGSISVTGEGNSTTTNLQQGLCKVWAVRSTGGTPSLSDGFNVSSIVDEGVGDTDYNITSSMSVVTNAFGNSDQNSANRRGIYTDNESTSKIRTLSYDTGGSGVDDAVSFICCGDLA